MYTKIQMMHRQQVLHLRQLNQNQLNKEWITTANFLQRKEYFGKYRVVAAYNMDTNDFPRTDAGLIDPSFDDLYINAHLVIRYITMAKASIEANIPL